MKLYIISITMKMTVVDQLKTAGDQGLTAVGRHV